MSYTLEIKPDAPIMVFIEGTGGDLVKDFATIIPEAVPMLDQHPEPLFLIIDLRGAPLGMEDLIQAASITARGKGPILHHHKVRKNLFIATDTLTRMAVKGMATPAFGQVNLALFETMEEALAYCEEQLHPVG